MAAVVLIGSGCGLKIKAHHRNQPNQSNLALYISHYFHLTVILNRQQDSVSIIKVGVVGMGIVHLSCI